MATRIRLRRVGRKNLPLYRIVVADQESPRDGRFIEVIGTYNPKGQTSADKIQVARMVERLLGVTLTGVRDDATDALAIAIGCAYLAASQPRAVIR